MTDRSIVILTALEIEYAAVRKHIVAPSPQRHRAGTRFDVGRLPGGVGQVALGLVGAGNHPAAVLAERAIATYEPAALLFVGVAGALWPGTALGTVVVASHVYAYHGGTSQDDGFKARPRAWEIDHGLSQLAHHVVRSGTWDSEVYFKPIAAGEVVQDSSISEHAKWVKQTYNDAMAIEMEAAGVAQAAHFNGGLPMAVIRGLSDHADGTKVTTDRKGWQAKAVANAAAVGLALADAITAEPGETRRSGTPEPNGQNIARDNARVGIQAGAIYGGVHQGDLRSSEPAGDLTALRVALVRARRSDRLDEATYAAAQTELGLAQRERSPLALKRLRGLVMDVPELVSLVEALIRGDS
ncbi:5'-methylthioadenosine/S-adenosylhomocysteine nucleosidase family protein [Herbidospora sp. RD11066]